MPCWIGSHIRAFEFFGGLPLLVTDLYLKLPIIRWMMRSRRLRWKCCVSSRRAAPIRCAKEELQAWVARIRESVDAGLQSVRLPATASRQRAAVEIDTTVLWFAFGATVFTRIAFWNRAGMANRETRSRHGSQAGRPWLVHSNVRTASNGLAGPPVTDHDDAEAAPVVLVNQSIVRKFWPNQNPLGKRVQIGNLPKLVQVVGVLGDAKNESLAQAAKDEVFVPHP